MLSKSFKIDYYKSDKGRAILKVLTKKKIKEKITPQKFHKKLCLMICEKFKKMISLNNEKTLEKC